MIPNNVGSRSIKIAPLSSLKLEIRPLSNAVKNVSGIQVKVCRDVENLQIFCEQHYKVNWIFLFDESQLTFFHQHSDEQYHLWSYCTTFQIVFVYSRKHRLSSDKSINHSIWKVQKKLLTCQVNNAVISSR